MRIAIMQSSFLPWRGYFDLMACVDRFVLFDDVAFVSKSWRSRNQIKTAAGVSWISVPVRHAWPRLSIDQTPLDDDQDWRGRITGQIRAAYGRAPFFRRYSEPLFALLAQSYPSISALNESLLRWVADELSIATPIVQARSFAAQGQGEDRVLDLLEKLGATVFVNGPSAEAYSTPERYDRAGIALFFKLYDYQPYPQLHGDFRGDVSAIDMLFNLGPAAAEHLRSVLAMRPASGAGGGR